MPIEPSSGELLSLREAAQISPYSAEYLNLLVRKGKINATKIGRDWLIVRSDLFKYIKKQHLETKNRQQYLEVFVNSLNDNEKI